MAFHCFGSSKILHLGWSRLGIRSFRVPHSPQQRNAVHPPLHSLYAAPDVPDPHRHPLTPAPSPPGVPRC